MQLKHMARGVCARFDDPNLVSCAGLVPVMGLAERCGLARLVGERVRIGSSARPVVKGNPGVNPGGKVPAIVAGMVAGADSIDDLAVVRHGGMTKLFDSTFAPSTLGSHLRAYDWGNACQLEQASRELLGVLAAHTPVLAGAEKVAFLDIDDARRRVFGRAKQGAGFGPVKVGGYQVKVRNLNPLIATISTPTAAPVIAATRLRGGRAASVRGAVGFAREAIGVATAAITATGGGATGGGLVLARMDSAFYHHKVIGACVDTGVRFSVTAPADPAITAAIESINAERGADAWTPIRYPHAIFDEQLGCWVSDAEVAETTYTAFATRRPVTARLIVRRVRDKNARAEAGQDELFTMWRYHAVFTDNPMPLIEAEECHRDHAGAVEHVFADLADGPLAHLPSGAFAANAAWLTCAAICHNLLRAAGSLASAFHARARGTTLRRHLINIPARLARSARRLTLHLPEHWPWQIPWHNLADTAHGPPATP